MKQYFVSLLLTPLLFTSSTLSAPPPPGCSCHGPAIGIGFDLTSTYVVAAAQFPNGTVLDIGRINASPEYTSLYNTLLQPPSFSPCAPYTGRLTLQTALEGVQNFILRRGQRPMCRDMPDLDPLSGLISSLKDMMESKLYPTGDERDNLPPTSVVITTEHLPGLIFSDLEGIMVEKDLMLENWISETEAAYHGMGWSSDMAELVLSLTFSFHQLTAKAEVLNEGALKYSFSPASHFPDPPLPHHVVSGKCSKKDEAAAVIKSKISGAFGRFAVDKMADESSNSSVNPPEKEVTRLLLLGERAEEKDFLDAVWRSLGELEVGTKVFEGLQVEGYWGQAMAARGAAEWGARAGSCGMEVEVVEDKEDEVNDSEPVVEIDEVEGEQDLPTEEDEDAEVNEDEEKEELEDELRV